MTGVTVDPEPHDTSRRTPQPPQLGPETPLRSVVIADVAELQAASSASNQWQTNVVTLAPYGHIGTHGETDLDVTLTVLLGSLTLRHGRDDDGTVAAVAAVVTAPAVVFLPAGTGRSLAKALRLRDARWCPLPSLRASVLETTCADSCPGVA
jgi:hypothetical protein